MATHPLTDFLARLVRREHLSREEGFELLEALLDAEATDAQISGALVALAAKGETVDELTGMAEGLRSRAIRVISQHQCFLDTAGTGSSRAKTFNISTAAAFVIAGAGLPVAKHGNRAASSKSGSADLLTALGHGAFQAGQGINDQLQDGNSFKISPRFGFAYGTLPAGTAVGEIIQRAGIGAV